MTTNHQTFTELTLFDLERAPHTAPRGFRMFSAKFTCMPLNQCAPGMTRVLALVHRRGLGDHSSIF